MARGGYRAPKKPAVVSGPGALSQRTDGAMNKQRVMKLPNPEYGEQSDFTGIQSAAPMSKSNVPMRAPIDTSRLVGLNAPTQFPDEPVTAGIDSGPGPGSAMLGMPTQADKALDDIQLIAEYLPIFNRYAATPDASNQFRAFIGYLRSQIDGN